MDNRVKQSAKAYVQNEQAHKHKEGRVRLVQGANEIYLLTVGDKGVPFCLFRAKKGIGKLWSIGILQNSS